MVARRPDRPRPAAQPRPRHRQRHACPLAVGACCEAPGGFDAVAVWERMASGEVTLFMAVPTVYARLVAAWEAADAATRRRWSAGAARAAPDGLAARRPCPVSTLERWRELTGHVLLERYGMTELGMALSNTLDERVPGHVGEPFPGVEVRVVDDAGRDVADGGPGSCGCAGRRCSPSTGDVRRPRPSRSPTAGSAPATSPCATRRVPPARPLVGRHHQDRRGEGVGAGDRGGPAHPPAVSPTAPSSASTTPSGASASPPPSSPRRAGRTSTPTPCGRGASSSWPRPRSRRAYVFVDELPRNTLGKVVKARVAELF